ncbi:MAG: hypothetical protein ACTSRZ_18595 [Promethearchaeota archaeon]
MNLNFKTIQIDDAGTGDIVGSAFIGFYIKETEKYLEKEIPLALFQQNYFNFKQIEDFVVKIIESALKELEFNPKRDKIEICRGNIFNKTIKMFKTEKYSFISTKIEDPLQSLVEKSYLNHLKSIGVDMKISLESGKKRYFQLFNWVVNNFPEREKFVKSGFPSWSNKWRQIAFDQYKRNLVRLKNKSRIKQ